MLTTMTAWAALTLSGAGDAPLAKGAESFSLASPLSEFQLPRFGEALAVDGPVLFVGAPGADTTGTDRGAVYVYRREGSVMSFVERIDPPADFSSTGFGAALAVQDGTLLVGADATSATKGLPALQAAIFARARQGWTFKQPVQSPVSVADDGFGVAVAISGDLIAVGADRDSEGGNERGAVHIFRPDISRQLQLIAKLRPDGTGKGTAGARFGKSLSAANGRLAVGAPGSPLGSTLAGRVYLFNAIQQNLGNRSIVTSSNAAAGDQFGRSVSLSGNNLLTGAPGEQSNAGAAYLYNVQNTTREIEIRPGGLAANEQFGRAVSLFGNQLIIGAPGAGGTTKGTGAAGSAFNFEISGDQVQGGSIDGGGGGTGIFSSGSSGEFGAATVASDQMTAISAPDGAGTVEILFDAEAVFTGGFEGFDLQLATLTEAGILSACPAGSEHESVILFDDMETGAPGWSHSGQNDTWGLSGARANSGVFSWRADALSVVGDQILVTPTYQRTASALAGANRTLVMSFYQYRDLQPLGGDCADGGLAESELLGGGVTQLADILSDPYDGQIIPASNPLQGRSAWCGNPGWQRTVIEVERGTDGPSLPVITTFQYRFRLGSDGNIGADTGFEGWFIDDFLLETCLD